MKAIETVYNGYRFRSRLEARWAVFFDAMNVKYEYEPEGFDLGDGYYYLPDFYLPDVDVWVEVKGKKLSIEEREKIERFCRAKCDITNNGSRFRLLEGQIPGNLIAIDNKIGIPIFSYISPVEFQRIVKKTEGRDIEEIDSGLLLASVWVSDSVFWTKENLSNALLKARQARFEHGEQYV